MLLLAIPLVFLALLLFVVNQSLLTPSNRRGEEDGLDPETRAKIARIDAELAQGGAGEAPPPPQLPEEPR